jgi:hypothetical protein
MMIVDGLKWALVDERHKDLCDMMIVDGLKWALEQQNIYKTYLMGRTKRKTFFSHWGESTLQCVFWNVTISIFLG